MTEVSRTVRRAIVESRSQGIDGLGWAEFGRLDAAGHVYPDYTGGLLELPSFSSRFSRAWGGSAAR
jgi:hypothetical protein